MSQQNVLGLEIAMYDAHVAQREEAERLEDLLATLANQVERNALERRVPQQVVQVVREHLEDQALVAAEHEVLLEAYDARGVGRVLLVEELEQLDLRLGLLQEGLLRLDDLDGDVLRLALVVRLDHLRARRASRLRREGGARWRRAGGGAWPKEPLPMTVLTMYRSLKSSPAARGACSG